MTDHTPAGYLRRTADDYDLHGPTTRRLLESDWSGEPSATSYEPKVSGSSSGTSPVERHVISADQARRNQAGRDLRGDAPSKHPAVLLDRWNKAHKTLELGSATTPASLRFYADTWPQISAERRSIVLTAARTITDLINLCRPMPPEIVDKLTRLGAAGGYCQACESVIGESTNQRIPSTKNVSGLCRPGCYEMEKRQEQRGTYIDRVTFIDHVKQGVARGEIPRQGSPLWRTAVPTIHEGDPAA